MPALEELSHTLKEQNMNLIGIASDAGSNQDALDTAKWILSEKKVTYQNLVLDEESAFYKEFVDEITGYPTSYLVDREGNIVGAPLIGNLDAQLDTLTKRMESIKTKK